MISNIERIKLCLLDEDEEVIFDGKQQNYYGNPNLHEIPVFDFSDEVIKLGLYNI